MPAPVRVLGALTLAAAASCAAAQDRALSTVQCHVRVVAAVCA